MDSISCPVDWDGRSVYIILDSESSDTPETAGWDAPAYLPWQKLDSGHKEKESWESTGVHLRHYSHIVEHNTTQHNTTQNNLENDTQKKKGRRASFCLHHSLP